MTQDENATQRTQEWQAWQHFWQSPLGRSVVQAEQALLQPWLEKSRGYHLLWIGGRSAVDALQASPIRHQMEWRPTLETADHSACLVADPAYLPLPDESVDCVLLVHSLEVLERPHALLKEAARVLLSKGEMLIVGFNPWSLWGSLKWMPSWMQPTQLTLFHQASLLPLNKLDDWLTFVDLQRDECQRGFYRPPCTREKTLSRLARLDQKFTQRQWPLNGIYVLKVSKRLGCPIQPLRRQQKTGWMPAQPVSSATRNLYQASIKRSANRG